MIWLVVRSKVRQELRAAENLKNQSFEVYCPMLVRHNGSEEALFPGYVFLRKSFEDASFSTVPNTRGVLGFVRFGLQFAEASDEIIKGIKDKEAQLHGALLFEKEQKVMISEGPLSGFEAIYLCKKGEERAVVLLNLLRQQQRVTVYERELVSAS